MVCELSMLTVVSHLGSQEILDADAVNKARSLKKLKTAGKGKKVCTSRSAFSFLRDD